MGHLYHTDYRHLGVSVLIHIVVISAALVFLPDANLTAEIPRQGSRDREITVYISERTDRGKSAIFPGLETLPERTEITDKPEKPEKINSLNYGLASEVPAASGFQAVSSFSAPREQFIKAKAKEDIKISYPMSAARRNIEGSVTVEILVDETGKIRNAEIINSSGYKVLDRAALDAVMQSGFVPAQLGGRKVSDTLKIIIDYKLTQDHL